MMSFFNNHNINNSNLMGSNQVYNFQNRNGDINIMGSNLKINM